MPNANHASWIGCVACALLVGCAGGGDLAQQGSLPEKERQVAASIADAVPSGCSIYRHHGDDNPSTAGKA